MSTASQPYPKVLGVVDVEDAKEALRTAIRAARLTRSERRQHEAAEAFAEVLETMPELRDARCVAAYVARASEPSTGRLLEGLAARGVRIILPVLGTGLQRNWAAYDGADDLRQRAPGRPPEPGTTQLGAGALHEADVIVAPALAVDTSGARLGQGGGWYDRALEHARPGTPVIAMVFAEEVYDAGTRPLPRQPHDRLVDAVATPEGWRWLRRPAAG